MKLPALIFGLLAVALAASGCTSAQDALEPSALLGNGTAPQPEFPMAAPMDQPGQTQTQVTAVVTDARIQVAPVIGAPAQASTPLAARLASRATARGITLVGAQGTSATYVMKGYFSAIAEPKETTVIYVWDVVDGSGNRVHRIQGQARTPGQSVDGWSSVQPQTMEAIADQTVDQLASWLVSRAG